MLGFTTLPRSLLRMMRVSRRMELRLMLTKKPTLALVLPWPVRVSQFPRLLLLSQCHR